MSLFSKSWLTKRQTAYLLVIVWMILIFILSGKFGAKSGSLSESTIADVKSYFPSLSEQLLTLAVRKSAHLFMYGVLGALLANLVRSYKQAIMAVVGYSLVVAGLYASSDEIHQYFVSSRSSSPRDVAIDTLGALIGVGVFLLVVKVWRMRTAVAAKV